MTRKSDLFHSLVRLKASIQSALEQVQEDAAMCMRCDVSELDVDFSRSPDVCDDCHEELTREEHHDAYDEERANLARYERIS